MTEIEEWNDGSEQYSRRNRRSGKRRHHSPKTSQLNEEFRISLPFVFCQPCYGVPYLAYLVSPIPSLQDWLTTCKVKISMQVLLWLLGKVPMETFLGLAEFCTIYYPLLVDFCRRLLVWQFSSLLLYLLLGCVSIK